MKRIKNNRTTPRIAQANGLEAQRAFERIRPDLEGLAGEDLVPANIDLFHVSSIVLGAEGGIRAIVPEIQDQLPKFDLENVEALRDTALAVLHVHTTASTVDDEVAKLVAVAAPLRRALLAQARTLVEIGLLDGGLVADLRGDGGARELALALMTLAAVYRKEWPRLNGKTPFSAADIDRASELGLTLAEAIGAREVGAAPDLEVDQGELRARAFSLLVKRYGEVKRAVEYVRRRHRDAHEIAPSLYAASRGRRSAAPEVPPAVSEPTLPAAPAHA